MTTPSQSELDLYQQIVGEQLSGVTFVMDYWQLQFNPPPTINVYSTLSVSCDGKTYANGDDQFRNMLCKQITKIVASVSIEDESAFRIVFVGGVIIAASLKKGDRRGPEALEFQGRGNRFNVI
jgi:hypothetical protein